MTGLQSDVTLTTREISAVEKESDSSNDNNSISHYRTKIIHKLIVSNAHGADNGYIICVAENIIGKKKDAAFMRINGRDEQF